MSQCATKQNNTCIHIVLIFQRPKDKLMIFKNFRYFYFFVLLLLWFSFFITNPANLDIYKILYLICSFLWDFLLYLFHKCGYPFVLSWTHYHEFPHLFPFRFLVFCFPPPPRHHLKQRIVLQLHIFSFSTNFLRILCNYPNIFIVKLIYKQ